MPHSIFIETTIPSYYVARPSRNPLQYTRQEITRAWWDFRRQEFELFTSTIVLDEAADGEPAMASSRIAMLASVPLLDISEQVGTLAIELVETRILPPMAVRDAAHLATAGVHGIDFLLTWNCKHIANPFIVRRLEACFSVAGVHLPIVCTPEQIIPDEDIRKRFGRER